jgi:hypothetical protein
MIDLSARVAVFPGHDKLPAEPDCIVTLDQFWEANQDFTFAEMLDIRNNLNAVGWARIGGGAAAAFTLKLLRDKLPSASSLAAAERDARLCKAAPKLYAALMLASKYVEATVEMNHGNPEALANSAGDLAQVEAAIAEAEGRA